MTSIRKTTLKRSIHPRFSPSEHERRGNLCRVASCDRGFPYWVHSLKLQDVADTAETAFINHRIFGNSLTSDHVRDAEGARSV